MAVSVVQRVAACALGASALSGCFLYVSFDSDAEGGGGSAQTGGQNTGGSGAGGAGGADAVCGPPLKGPDALESVSLQQSSIQRISLHRRGDGFVLVAALNLDAPTDLSLWGCSPAHFEGKFQIGVVHFDDQGGCVGVEQPFANTGLADLFAVRTTDPDLDVLGVVTAHAMGELRVSEIDANGSVASGPSVLGSTDHVLRLWSALHGANEWILAGDIKRSVPTPSIVVSNGETTNCVWQSGGPGGEMDGSTEPIVLQIGAQGCRAWTVSDDGLQSPFDDSFIHLTPDGSLLVAVTTDSMQPSPFYRLIPFSSNGFGQVGDPIPFDDGRFAADEVGLNQLFLRTQSGTTSLVPLDPTGALLQLDFEAAAASEATSQPWVAGWNTSQMPEVRCVDGDPETYAIPAPPGTVEVADVLALDGGVFFVTREGPGKATLHRALRKSP